MNNLLKILFIAAVGNWSIAYGQNSDDSLILEHVEGGSRQLEFVIPSDYVKTDTLQYMEGFIKTFTCADKSYISVLCGANANLELSEDSANLHSRKIEVEGFQITYGQVPQARHSLFYRAFDLSVNNKLGKRTKGLLRFKK